MASERLIVTFGAVVGGIAICGGGQMLLAADFEQLDAVVSADFFPEIVEEFEYRQGLLCEQPSHVPGWFGRRRALDAHRSSSWFLIIRLISIWSNVPLAAHFAARISLAAVKRDANPSTSRWLPTRAAMRRGRLPSSLPPAFRQPRSAVR
jgi:hypothetical protein